METVEIITALLSKALGNPYPEGLDSSLEQLDEEQWRVVLGALAAQNVHTLVSGVLPSDLVPESVASIWQNQTEAVVALNKKTEVVAAEQEEAWKKLGLNYALLKGMALASLYPDSSIRGAGDIDWYFADDVSWNDALALARKNADEGIHMDSDGDVNYTFNGVVIEHHRDWSHLSSRILRKKAGAPTIDDGRLSPGDTIFSLECHILHHLAFKGLSLKQFADLSEALKSYDGRYNKMAFADRMCKIGLGKWSGLLHAALRWSTGLQEEYFPLSSPASERDVERLAEVVLCDGACPGGRKFQVSVLSKRILLMLRFALREGLARYFYLVKGRLGRAL